MKVYRYMSNAEFNKLINGQSLHNPKVRNTACSNSCGFCFLAETTTFTTRDFDGQEKTYEYTPEECSSFLDGIISEDVLVEFDVLDTNLLNCGFGVYMNPVTVRYDVTIRISEYSCHTYDRTVLRPIRYMRGTPECYTDWRKQHWVELSAN